MNDTIHISYYVYLFNIFSFSISTEIDILIYIYIYTHIPIYTYMDTNEYTHIKELMNQFKSIETTYLKIN